MIELSHVHKRFGGIRAVVDVNFAIDRGQVALIEGSNGSGKSTLLGMLGTLIRPTSGVISFGELGDTLEEVRRHIGWVGHDTLCYGDLSAWENLALAAVLSGTPKAEALERAKVRFGLGDFANRPVRTYSRGQRQRVALARALVAMPTLLLLDEPSTGLDPASVERLSGVVLDEVQRNAAVVIITHDAKFADAIRGGVGDDKCKSFQMDRGRLR